MSIMYDAKNRRASLLFRMRLDWALKRSVKREAKAKRLLGRSL
ncbi:hypothetical protein [Methylotenera sp.]|nr:hypothetical protein [Methylotenera sp.]MDI1362529.1 hypothetical protein [Methylotenera sp.]